MSEMIKVLFLTNIPSPYMVGYLNELGKYCDLNVVFEKEFDSTRPESWKNLLVNTNFTCNILKGKSVNKRIYGDTMDSAPDDKALSLAVIKFLKEKYDFIIVANPCTPTGIIAIFYMQLKKIPYSIQSEGGYPGNGKGLKEKLKYLLMGKAEYYFSTCDMDDAYFMQYGATKEKIRRYPFASISEKKLPEEFVDKKIRRCYKEKLGINYEKMILSVGRSVYVKGFDLLLHAVKDLPKDVCTYFVGGTCVEEYQKIIDQYHIRNVFFVDNVEQEKLIEYYKAADIFVLPTRSDTWGLVINEAMTYGLPVITTDKCVAGDALIENGKNGYIVKTENISELNESINKLISDDNLSIEFGKINYGKMREWTFEVMGKTVSQIIESIHKGEKN